jgi:hypothetical protein
MVEKSLLVQKHLVPEIRNVLNTDGKLQTNALFRALTQVQLLQLADATAHIKNIHSVVVNSLGSSSAGKDLLRRVPILSSAQALAEITTVARAIAADTPEIRAEIASMAKRGMVRPEYPATGINRITHMQQIIHQVDTASRVIMNRRFNNLVERGLATNTIENRRNFVQQIGEYNRRLMTRSEVTLRDFGISPFVVAGKTFNRFSRRLIAGSPGFESPSGKAVLAARTAQISGLLFAATLPALVNIFTTGSMGGRQGTPIGAIDFGEENDTEDGKRRVLDVFQLVGIRRGLRGTGLDALIEGAREGKTTNQILGDALEGIKSTALHPYVGPGLGGAYQVITGKRIDLRARSLTFSEARKFDGAKQFLENARVALKTQNPFLAGVFQHPVNALMERVFGIPLPTDDKTAVGQTVEGMLKAPLSAVGYREKEKEGKKAPWHPAG